MIWFALAVMLLVAAFVVALPMYRRAGRITPAVALATATVLLVPAVLYLQIGTPVPPAQPADIDDMVASLAARLEDDPEDLEGWKMLGRSYFHLQDWTRAVAAYERAMELEGGRNAQTLADLGEAMLLRDGGSVSDEARQLFDSALAIEASNPKALFYGGVAAVERGNEALAAERWEALLALSPPPEIQDILRSRIAAWRGEVPAAQAPPTAASSEPVVSANVALSPAARAAVDPGATVFVIARDPAQPTPPVAAVRRSVAQLPATITLSDADAMMPGRVPSSFTELEVVARVSVSGRPQESIGDWYGSQTIATEPGEPVDIVIGQQIE